MGSAGARRVWAALVLGLTLLAATGGQGNCAPAKRDAAVSKAAAAAAVGQPSRREWSVDQDGVTLVEDRVLRPKGFVRLRMIRLAPVGGVEHGRIQKYGVEFDCRRLTYRFLEMETLTQDLDPIGERQLPNKWTPISVGTAWEDLARPLCAGGILSSVPKAPALALDDLYDHYFRPAPARWVVLSGNDELMLVDKPEPGGGDIRRGRSSTIYRKPGDGVAFMTVRFEADCLRRRYRLLRMAFLAPDLRVLNDLRGGADWAALPPDSEIGAGVLAVCGVTDTSGLAVVSDTLPAIRKTFLEKGAPSAPPKPSEPERRLAAVSNDVAIFVRQPVTREGDRARAILDLVGREPRSEPVGAVLFVTMRWEFDCVRPRARMLHGAMLSEKLAILDEIGESSDWTEVDINADFGLARQAACEGEYPGGSRAQTLDLPTWRGVLLAGPWNDDLGEPDAPVAQPVRTLPDQDVRSRGARPAL